MDLLISMAVQPGRALESAVAKLAAGLDVRAVLKMTVVLALAVSAGCASMNDSGGAPGSPGPSAEARPEGADSTDDAGEEESAREGPEEGPLRAYDPGAGSPERAASRRVVRRGLEHMREGDADGAARLLERAVRIDPSNGRAYLRLAQARMMLGEYEEARGLLDRAVAYLRPSPGLRRMAEHLRAAIPDTAASRP